MSCQYCQVKLGERRSCSYHSGSFVWDHICESCRDHFKLADWNEACRPVGEQHAVNQN